MNAPKPPLPFLLAAIIVVGCSLWLVALSAAAMAVTWNPCAVIGGLIMLPIPTVVLFAQGWAAYPGSARAAGTSSVLLFGIGGFAFLSLAISIGEMSMEGTSPPLGFVIPFATVGAICCWAAWLNRRWSQRLAEYESQRGEPKLRPSWRRGLAVPAATFGSAAALAAYFILTEPPQYAEHVARDAAPVNLPPGATDVSYCLGVRGAVAYEFTITESEFRAWVQGGIGSIESEAANIPLKPIDDQYTILRFLFLTNNNSDLEEAVITDGLFYEWIKEDRGVYSAFDRQKNRAYYHAHFH